MNKPTKNKPNYNTTIKSRLKEKYGVSDRFIRMSISGERKSETSDKIAQDYKKMLKEVDNTLKQL